MNTHKPDRRVLRTRRAIRSAFSELLVQKDISSITVKDVADTADINRKTFYNYYSGVHQVLEEIEDEIVSAFEADLTDFDFDRDVQDPRGTFRKVTALLASDPEFYGRLFEANSISHLGDKLTGMIRDKTAAFFKANVPGDPGTLEIAADYVVYGIMAVHRSWYNSGRSISIEEVSNIVGRLVVSGLSSFLPIPVSV